MARHRHVRSPKPARPVDGGGRQAPVGIRSLASLRSIVGQMFLLQLVVVLLIAVGAGLLLVYTIQHEKSENASQRALAVAEGFANAPGVATAMTSPGASEVLQPQARAAMQGADVDFVTVVDRQGIRLTSAIPSLIGRRSNQDMAPLLAGRTVQSRTTGTLSSQFRAFVPVENDDGKVVGAVGAAVRMSSVSDSVNRQLPLLLGAPPPPSPSSPGAPR